MQKQRYLLGTCKDRGTGLVSTKLHMTDIGLVCHIHCTLVKHSTHISDTVFICHTLFACARQILHTALMSDKVLICNTWHSHIRYCAQKSHTALISDIVPICHLCVRHCALTLHIAAVCQTLCSHVLDDTHMSYTMPTGQNYTLNYQVWYSYTKESVFRWTLKLYMYIVIIMGTKPYLKG